MCGIIASIALGTSYCLACPKEQSLPGDGRDSLSHDSLADSLHHTLTNGFQELLTNCFVCKTAIKDQTTNGKPSQGNKADSGTRKKMAWPPGHAKKHMLESKLLAGLDQIHHRGPDSQGTWINQSNAVGKANLHRHYELQC